MNDDKLDAIKSNSVCINDRVLLYMNYCCDKLGFKIGDAVDNIRKDIRVDDNFVVKNPRSLASGLVYLNVVAYGISITQRDIAQVLNMSEVTIRRMYKQIREVYNPYE